MENVRHISDFLSNDSNLTFNDSNFVYCSFIPLSLNFPTRERANSSLDENASKMISEVFSKVLLNGSIIA